ncbi:MAG: ankyrin repeat domain-containing protein [Alphaproteobacteria bacterium]
MDSREITNRNKLISLSAFLCLVLTLPLEARAGELHDAVRAGDIAAIETLLASGADIDETDYATGTALHVAVAQGDESIVAVLIEMGADLEANSELNGARALHLAADFDERAIIGLLLANGADIEARDGLLRTPLHRAAEAGFNDLVALLIDHGAEVNDREGYFGATPLQQAAENGRLETVKLLLQRGADINAIDQRGFSALWCASQLQSFRNVGDSRLIEYLVSQGADLHVKNAHGQTPWVYAESRGWKEIAEVLRSLESPD